MDTDDEMEIRKALKNLTNNIDNNTLKINTVIQISDTLSSQIHNITTHINKQQNIVGKYINKFKYEIQNRISSIEQESY